MNSPLVTIGIPTYNRASGYFKETLECALAQTYPNMEVVISDNCSTDNTDELVRGYTDLRIKYIKQPKPLAPTDNFNYILNNANGDYFLLLHDDDLIDRDFVEICMRFADNRTDYGIIRTGSRIIDDNGNTVSELENLTSDLSLDDFFIAWLDSKTWLFLCSTLFNRTGLLEIGGFSSRNNLFNDVLVEIKLAAKYGRLDIPDIKAGMRKHGSQRTYGARIMEWCEDSEQLLALICSLASDKKDIIKKKGQVHFSKHNYDLAMSVNSPFEKIRFLNNIYKRFDNSISPIPYVYNKKLRPITRYFKNKLFGVVKKITKY